MTSMKAVSVSIDVPHKIIISVHFQEDTVIAEVEYADQKPERSATSNIAIGVAVCSYARILLARALTMAGVRAVYCDTGDTS